MTTLLISEIFGPTIQGEGANLGLPSIFVRTAGCPLSCAWCDTPYTWDWTRHDRAAETTRQTPEAVWEHVIALAADTKTSSLVLTGGEPASQATGLIDVVRSAHAVGWQVGMETSGAVHPGPLVGLLDLITVSPKLASSRVGEDLRIRPTVLADLAGRIDTVWKFVIDDQADLDEADRLVAKFQPSRVYVMAQATTVDRMVERTEWLVPHAISRGWNVTPRLHVLLWGDTRGH